MNQQTEEKTSSHNRIKTKFPELAERLSEILTTQKDQTKVLDEINKWHKEEVLGKAWITSAIRLSESELKVLSSQIERIFGRSLVIENVIDKNIIGGVKIQVGDQIIDQTVEGKLQYLKKELTT